LEMIVSLVGRMGATPANWWDTVDTESWWSDHHDESLDTKRRPSKIMSREAYASQTFNCASQWLTPRAFLFSPFHPLS